MKARRRNLSSVIFLLTAAAVPAAGCLAGGADIDDLAGEADTTEEAEQAMQGAFNAPGAGPRGVDTVAAGLYHNCAVKGDGKVHCWGRNNNGQLGDGTLVNSSSTVEVTGITGAISVRAGSYHTCALLSGGTVSCWGWNGLGQLGDGTTVSKSTPQPVPGLSGVRALAAGHTHTCALLAGGGVKCWGYNGYGQLGNGTTTNAPTPVTVTGLTGATRIATGDSHSCALLADGTARCWGSNYYGETGDGTMTNRTTPVTVSGLSGVRSLSATALGRHTCVTLGDGQVKCWGDNNHGQLGDGTTTLRRTPVSVQSLTLVASVTAGSRHSCARMGDGTVKCWGHNAYGELGNGGTTHSSTPVTAIGLDNIVSTVSGYYHMCAVAGDGTISCVGSNAYGQLGDGTLTSSLVPVTVETASQTTFAGVRRGAAIAAGTSYTCGLEADGTVKCWGNNGGGQLAATITGGNYYSAEAVIARDVNNDPVQNVVDLSAGYGTVCALHANGEVSCWGSNDRNQIAEGSLNSKTRATKLAGVNNVIAMETGGRQICTVHADGELFCWGGNYRGELGDGTLTNRSISQRYNVTTPSSFKAVSVMAANEHTCALTPSGGAKCWGRGDSGQRGDGSSAVSVTTPTSVNAVSGAVALTGSSENTCALFATGAVKCWGSNLYGQLGIDKSSVMVAGYLEAGDPVKVAGSPANDYITDAVALSLGARGNHTCLVRVDGSVWCWGMNGYGQSGQNTVSPHKVIGASAVPGTGIVAIGVGETHTCSIRGDNTAWCWGSESTGQLGNGQAGASFSVQPEQVIGFPTSL